MNTDICIIGAGPAGLMAAITAAESGAKVTLIERNTSAGRKLRHTGGGRCNLTHDGSIGEFVKAYGPAGRFLKHSLYEFSADDLRTYFAGRGVPTKVLEDGCVFGVTENAGDVARALIDHAKQLGVQLLYDKPVDQIEKTGDAFIVRAKNETISTQSVIVATGGASWPKTGSTGDGYMFAKAFGHTIITPRAALTTLKAKEAWAGQLAGVAVSEIVIKTKIGKRQISQRGPLVFTDKGIGGPAVLNMSNHLTDRLPNHENPIPVTIDLLPGYTPEELDKEIIALCQQYPKKELPPAIVSLLPKSLITAICHQLDAAPNLTASTLSKKLRHKLVEMLKHLPLSIVATGPLEQATITRGGVSLDEVNRQTMESKLQPGLFFAGEVLNADGPCGGYNLQIAFSTGHLAGKSAVL
ncbi:MAG: BaiN/RdsA family NAD(P)/FAD-dependent oxidoreductase [Planctomycetota bacterium]|jgi:predicted Rossmann fold flavoprotein